MVCSRIGVVWTGKFYRNLNFFAATAMIKNIYELFRLQSFIQEIFPITSITQKLSFLSGIKIGMFILHAKTPSRIWSIVNQNFVRMILCHRHRRVIMLICILLYYVSCKINTHKWRHMHISNFSYAIMNIRFFCNHNLIRYYYVQIILLRKII